MSERISKKEQVLQEREQEKNRSTRQLLEAIRVAEEECRQQDLRNAKKIAQRLPEYCEGYKEYLSKVFRPSTCAAYMSDAENYFMYLTYAGNRFEGVSPKDIPVTAMEGVTEADLLKYDKWLCAYVSKGKICRVGESGRIRRVSGLRQFLSYLKEAGLIKEAPWSGKTRYVLKKGADAGATINVLSDEKIKAALGRMAPCFLRYGARVAYSYARSSALGYLRELGVFTVYLKESGAAFEDLASEKAFAEYLKSHVKEMTEKYPGWLKSDRYAEGHKEMGHSAFRRNMQAVQGYLSYLHEQKLTDEIRLWPPKPKVEQRRSDDQEKI